MGSAYTPGLTVSKDTIVQRTRRLPIKGEVLVSVGQEVQPDTVVARAMLPGILQTIRLAEKLGVEAREAPGFFQLAEGADIEVGQVIAETKGFMGYFKAKVASDFAGVVETVSPITGNVLVREPSTPVDVTAYVHGKIVSVIPDEGATVETRGAMVQGIFGVGGERHGSIRVAVGSPDDVLDASHIQASDAGKILVGGSSVTYDALVKANETGVVGLVAGAVRDVDLIKFLGFDIGVAITGQEPINVTLLCTEGFGNLRMAERTFSLLREIEGRFASMNGATQIRAGVIRPEIIAPAESVSTGAAPEHSASVLDIGTPIRVIREPYFGLLGKVTGLPAQLVTVDSGAEVRVLKAMLDDGREVTVPRANVEIIATA